MARNTDSNKNAINPDKIILSTCKIDFDIFTYVFKNIKLL